MTDVGHQITLEERLEAKIERGIGCWLWKGFVDKAGYGRIRLGGREVGQIPDGLEIDHVCRNRACVRPDHLEPVQHSENVRRGAHAVVVRTGRCSRGHDMLEHGYRRLDGRGFNCRECRRELRAKAGV